MNELYENTDLKILEARNQKVIKHNDLVQKSRFTLSLVEQKTVNFIISLIKPGENKLEYEFEIKDYCRICGIDYANGRNYKMVRETLRSLCKKDAIVKLLDGTDTRVSWLNKFWSNKGKGWAKVRLDEDMAPYLFNLCNNTTRYELLYVLPMKSKYSIRLYEICKSWAKLRQKTYELQELRALLMIESGELERFPDFRRNVLEIAQKEINFNTNLNVSYEFIKSGRKIVKVRIKIREKTTVQNKVIMQYVNNSLDKKKEH